MSAPNSRNWRLYSILIVIALVVSWTVWQQAPGRLLTVGNRTYKLEVVREPADVIRGLGGRQSLGRDAGMLFVYDQAAVGRCFWMKDMRFSIDIIWLDSSKRVVHIEPGVSPQTYPKEFCPATTSQYVIELNAGEAKHASIHNGDTLEF